MRRLIFLAFAVALPAAASSPSDFASVIPIETPGESAAWQVELDGSVYQASVDPNLRDMAVFNANGQAVPMMLWPVEIPDSMIEQRSAVPVLPLPTTRRSRVDADLRLIIERDSNGRLRRLDTNATDEPEAAAETNEWLLDLEAFDHGIDQLELSWEEPANDVIAHFEVSSSNDLQRWDVLNADATVVLLAQDGAQIDRRSIALSTNRFHYLRLRRTDIGPALLGLGVVASRERHVAGIPRVQWLEARSVSEIAGLTASKTRHLYSLAYPVPATAAMISLGSDNSLAQVDVLSSVDDTPAKVRWSHRARAVIFQLHQGTDVIDSGRVEFIPGNRIRAVRIDSETSLTAAPAVVIGYRPARLVFLAEGRGPYLLAVGSVTTKHPNYPVEAALASLRSRLGKDWQPPSAQLGDSRANTGSQALRVPDAPVNWKRWLLWGVLIGAAAVVGGIAVSLLRGGSQGGAEDRQQPPEE
jgi:hypothetical protein